MPRFESTFEDMRPDLELSGLKNLFDIEYSISLRRKEWPMGHSGRQFMQLQYLGSTYSITVLTPLRLATTIVNIAISDLSIHNLYLVTVHC